MSPLECIHNYPLDYDKLENNQDHGGGERETPIPEVHCTIFLALTVDQSALIKVRSTVLQRRARAQSGVRFLVDPPDNSNPW